jgi:hypothetical protein
MDPRFIAALGARISDEDAQVIGQRIVQLAEEKQVPIVPEDMVNDARSESSPIHGYFTWDDRVAADKWRVEEAKYYLRTIHIIEAPESEPIRLTHVVTVTTEDGEERKGYMDIRRIRTQPDLLEQVIESAHKELIGWQKRYRQYKQLAPIADGYIQLAIGQLATMGQMA